MTAMPMNIAPRRGSADAVSGERGDRKTTLLAGGLAGLAAALLMTLVMLLLRSGLGISPPPEMGPDRAAPLMPIDVFFFFLNALGGYNGAKQFGVGSVLIGQLVVGTLFGLLYASRVERWRGGDADPERVGIDRRGVLLVAGAVIGLWLLTLGLLWPTLGSNYRGLPPFQATIATALGLLLSYTSYGVALVLAYRFVRGTRFHRPARDGQPTAGWSIGRRSVLIGGVGVVFGLASGGLLRRLFGLASFGYDGTRYTDPSLPPITPNDQFYVVTKNVVDPSVSRSLWRLEVAGLVNRGQSFRFEDLAAMPAVTQETTLMCISNGVGDALMSNTVWKGVPLRALLEAAGPRPGVFEVVLHGVDGYTDTVPIEKAMEPTTLAVYEMNGEPLSESHGFPVRMIVPGMFGEKNVKWVTRVELVDHDVQGFYEQQGWGPNFVIPIRTRFFSPDFSQPPRLGAMVPLKGVAFAGDQGVSRVEVSLDNGQTWQEARIDYPGVRTGWSIWSYEWRPTRAGEYGLAVRASDAVGRPQPAENQGIVPEGARGYHWMTAQVVA